MSPVLNSAGALSSLVIWAMAKAGLVSSSRCRSRSAMRRARMSGRMRSSASMHAIVSAHPDLNADRAGQYTPHWLRCELLRLRAKDASRDGAVPRHPPPPSPHDEFRPMTTYSEVNAALHAYNAAAVQRGRPALSWRHVAERCGVQPQVFFDHCDAIAESQRPVLSPDAEALAAAVLRDLEEQTAALLSARGNGADPDEEPGAKQEARADAEVEARSVRGKRRSKRRRRTRS